MSKNGKSSGGPKIPDFVQSKQNSGVNTAATPQPSLNDATRRRVALTSAKTFLKSQCTDAMDMLLHGPATESSSSMSKQSTRGLLQQPMRSRASSINRTPTEVAKGALPSSLQSLLSDATMIGASNGCRDSGTPRSASFLRPDSTSTSFLASPPNGGVKGSELGSPSPRTTANFSDLRMEESIFTGAESPHDEDLNGSHSTNHSTGQHHVSPGRLSRSIVSQEAVEFESRCDILRMEEAARRVLLAGHSDFVLAVVEIRRSPSRSTSLGRQSPSSNGAPGSLSPLRRNGSLNQMNQQRPTVVMGDRERAVRGSSPQHPQAGLSGGGFQEVVQHQQEQQQSPHYLNSPSRIRQASPPRRVQGGEHRMGSLIAGQSSSPVRSVSPFQDSGHHQQQNGSPPSATPVRPTPTLQLKREPSTTPQGPANASSPGGMFAAVADKTAKIAHVIRLLGASIASAERQQREKIDIEWRRHWEGIHALGQDQRSRLALQLSHDRAAMRTQGRTPQRVVPGQRTIPENHGTSPAMHQKTSPLSIGTVPNGASAGSTTGVSVHRDPAMSLSHLRTPQGPGASPATKATNSPYRSRLTLVKR